MGLVGLAWGSLGFGLVGLPCGCFIITKTLKAKSACDDDNDDNDDDDDDEGRATLLATSSSVELQNFW